MKADAFHKSTVDTGDVRCDCGSLLARQNGQRIEVKCRRCRRLVCIAVVERVFDHSGCLENQG